MAKKAFYQWLMKQDKREDPVGDLARDYIWDRRVVLKTGGTFQEWKTYETALHRIVVFGGDHVVRETLKEAWKEYKADERVGLTA